MSRRWFVLQHVAWEPAGLIAEVARERAIPVEIRRMDLGDVVPSLEETAGLVAMGGPMGVRDASALPFLSAEVLLLRAAVEREVPVLGVCLGSQLLAAALGGRVERGSTPEVGLGEVRLTEDGRRDPVLGRAGPTVRVVHWHEDTFEIPRGGVRLAESALYPNQAFRIGTRAYGFQFHVEVDRALATAWAARVPPGTHLDAERCAQVGQVGREIIARFFEVASARRPAR
ncbi:MAG: type 1 glutamine amidotransferase [Candidatus Latescibacterota bacterium]